MAERIGFIGLGQMGQGMASNLLKAGYSLHVYNRTRHKAAVLAEQGAKVVHDPAQTAEPGGIVITSLANDHAVESVVLGDEGLLDRLGPNGIHVSMSTIAPTTARRLAEHHQKYQVSYVAAPVFGRPEAAAARQLWIVLSGAQAAKDRVRPILMALGQGLFDFGEAPWTANIVKLCGNFLIAANALCLSCVSRVRAADCHTPVRARWIQLSAWAKGSRSRLANRRCNSGAHAGRESAARSVLGRTGQRTSRDRLGRHCLGDRRGRGVGTRKISSGTVFIT